MVRLEKDIFEFLDNFFQIPSGFSGILRFLLLFIFVLLLLFVVVVVVLVAVLVIRVTIKKRTLLAQLRT